MPSKNITDAFVRDVKLPRKDGALRQTTYIDTLERGLALVLVVSYGGTRTFRVMTYVDGKPQSRKLGSYPQMTVKDARALARDYWANPQKFLAQAEVGSFKEIAEDWYRRHVEKNQLLSRREIRRILEKYLYPKWQSRRFLEIRRLEVNVLLDEIEDASGQSQADAVLAVIRGIATWYQSRNELYVSPIVRGMKRDKRTAKEKSRARFLNDDEIRLVWKEADNCGTFGQLVKVMLLTGQRRTKAGHIRWRDISEDGIWTIPAGQREKGTPNALKLSQTALDIIAARPRIADNPYVFAGSLRGRRRSNEKSSVPPAFNSFSQGKRHLDEKLPKDMPRWTIHDLRRTARKLMTRAGVRPDVAELAIGHSIKGIQAVYDDPREYQPMINHAYQCVANEIDKIINRSNPNVVAMTKGRRK